MLTKEELRAALLLKQAQKNDTIEILAAASGVLKNTIKTFLKTGIIDNLSYQILASLS